MNPYIDTTQTQKKVNQLYQKTRNIYKIRHLNDEEIQFFLENLEFVNYTTDGSSMNQLQYILSKEKKQRENNQIVKNFIKNTEEFKKDIYEIQKKNTQDIQTLLKDRSGTQNKIGKLEQSVKKTKQQLKGPIEELEKQVQHHNNFQQTKTPKYAKSVSICGAVITLLLGVISGLTYILAEQCKIFCFLAGIITIISALLLPNIPLILMCKEKQFQRLKKDQEMNEAETQNNLVQGEMMIS